MQRRFIATITLALVLCPWAKAKPDEKPVGHVVFVQKSDGTLQPIFPVRIKVSQESGKITQRAGSLECEVRARVKDVQMGGQPIQVIQTILKCDDGGSYVVVGTVFTGER